MYSSFMMIKDKLTFSPFNPELSINITVAEVFAATSIKDLVGTISGRVVEVMGRVGKRSSLEQ